MKSVAARRQDRYNILIGAGVLVLAVGIVCAAVYLYFSSQESKETVTQCPASGPIGHVVLLVDRTDPLTFTQRQAFLQLLTDIGKGKVKQGELLSVFVLGEDYKSAPTPIFEMCNPGKGEDKNIWTSNPEKLRKLHEQKFLGPMTSLAGELLSTQSAQHSPILEMLQMVSINGFRKQAVRGPKTLIVVSDMLHNTSDFSHYRGEMDFAGFKSMPQFPKLQTDLESVEVELHYLLTSPSLQTRRHVKFWEDYFLSARARLVLVKPMEG